MLMLILNETTDLLAMANSVHWHGYVLRRALHIEVEGQRMKERLKKTWKKQIEGESIKVGLCMEDALCRSKWSAGVNPIATKLR